MKMILQKNLVGIRRRMAKAMAEDPLTQTPPDSSDDEIEEKRHAEVETRHADPIPVQPTTSLSTPEAATNTDTISCFFVEDNDDNNPNPNEPRPSTPTADYNNPNILKNNCIKRNDNERSRAFDAGLSLRKKLAAGKHGGWIVHNPYSLTCCQVCRVVISKTIYKSHCNSKPHKKKLKGEPRLKRVTKECKPCKWRTDHRSYGKAYKEHVNGRKHRRMMWWLKCGGL